MDQAAIPVSLRLLPHSCLLVVSLQSFYMMSVIGSGSMTGLLLLLVELSRRFLADIIFFTDLNMASPPLFGFSSKEIDFPGNFRITLLPVLLVRFVAASSLLPPTPVDVLPVNLRLLSWVVVPNLRSLSRFVIPNLRLLSCLVVPNLRLLSCLAFPSLRLLSCLVVPNVRSLSRLVIPNLRLLSCFCGTCCTEEPLSSPRRDAVWASISALDLLTALGVSVGVVDEEEEDAFFGSLMLDPFFITIFFLGLRDGVVGCVSTDGFMMCAGGGGGGLGTNPF
jgi:hypothetical protein